MLKNTDKKSVLIGMSGGVDSSVAALLLKESGYNPLGVTLKLHSISSGEIQKLCGSMVDAVDAAKVCENLGFKHFTFDFEEKFKSFVMERFVRDYRLGKTPNPCIECNRYIKFKEMENKLAELSADFIATGHYAKIEKVGDRYFLTKPKDKAKDQTYVLYMLSQQTLSHTLFPLGDLSKEEVRKIAEQNGFSNANKPDSQDICFVPDGDYAKFITGYDHLPLSIGNFVDGSGKVLGTHKGTEKYTIGQRKGLGMGFGKPMFVVKKDIENKSVILGDEELLFTKRIIVNSATFSAFDTLTAPIKCSGKIRYRQREEQCTIHPLDENTVLAEFENPQRAPAPGQAAVFYDGDTLLGGGTIV